MSSKKFKNFLKNLGFSDSDFKGEPRYVFVYEVPIDETQSKDVIYVHTPTDEDIFPEHQKLWNQNVVNIFVAVGNDKTYLIDAKVKPDEDNPVNAKIKSFDYGVNSEGFEKEKLKEITKESIDATYFFDFIIKNRKKPQEVDKDLLLNLIALRNDLVEIKNDEKNIHLLILRCLFIKYLEDKKIFNQNFLVDALASNQPSKLIEAFEEIKKINGDIFKFDKQILETEIDTKYLEKLKEFFIYDYLTKQGRLFPYLFDQIPIQLISNVYEAFLNNDKRQGKGIYYTPPFLVNFILSHSLKEKLKENRNVTVFDPAVGSASFLVESFKAIVKPEDSYEKKKSILENQLFGVDVDENALPIAAFSLYLALIETENPKFIRKQIEISNPILPSLIGQTLLQANALTDEVFEGKTFDCIVSNPPWGSAELNGDEENIKERNAIRKKGEQGIMPDGTKSEYKNVSDYERSQAFLIRVKKWCNEKTICSLVVKNSIFLNAKAEDFRKDFLNTYQLNYFYELSNYNKILFKKQPIGEINGQKIEIGAKEPCAVVMFELPKSEFNKFKYISPKLNGFSENFQIIHYTPKDINEVEQIKFIKNDEDGLLWRILVNGDFEDYKLIRNKLSVKDELEIECRSGFKPTKNMKKLGEPIWKYIIHQVDFERYNIINKNLGKFNWNQELERRRSEEIFLGNKILIPLEQSKIDCKKLRGVRISKEVVFTSKILCIKFKKNQRYLNNYAPYLAIINSKLIGYYLHNVSVQLGKGKTFNTLRNFEIEDLPILYLKDNQVRDKLTELVIKVESLKADGKSSIEKENQIDDLVFDLYGLKEYEKEIIREFYQIKVERAEKKNKFVKKSDIENYAEKFVEVFDLMLEADSKLVAAKYNFSISANLGAIICFTIVDKNDDVPLVEDKTLEILHFVKNKQITQADATKILNEDKVKIYDGKLMYIIKSNLFKDWTARQAIKDAREEIHLLLSALPETNE